MLTKLRTFASLYRELGFRWSVFRVAYAFRLRTGLLRLQMPQYRWGDRPLGAWLKQGIPSTPEAYAQWRKQHSPKFFFDFSRAERSDGEDEAHWDKQSTITEADRILNGEIKYFSHDFVQTGFPPNWHKDYFSHVTLSDSEGSLPRQNETLQSQQSLTSHRPDVLRESDMLRHWSKYSDDGDSEHVAARRSWFSLAPPARAGVPKQSPRNRGLLRREDQGPSSQRHVDIKFIWEANRFSFVYTLVRAYAASHDEKYAEAFWQLTESWAESNPPNTGPNWMDGQELALRLMAWTFGYYQFSNSPSSTPQRIARFITLIASHAERIHQNTSFAIFTHGNHSITEALGLWMTGLLFPELKNSEKYLSFGRMSLEREAGAQIFPDGTYSMYSINYHRFILHIYLYAIRLGELNHFPFSTQLQNSIAKSIEYLSQLIDPQTGQMPVYGSNDGALALPLNNCDFTDYRPLLQLGSVITKGERLFEPGPWDEDVFWLCGTNPLSQWERVSEGQVREKSESSFPHGGIYLLRNTNSKALIRCTDFRARPSHADQLHVDFWIHGHNIACDAGTYLYSGEGMWRNGLARTSAHNTVIVDGKDQMAMVSRFTWTNWSKGKVLKHEKDLWQGEHDGYKPVSHKRTVMMLDGDRWLVIDHLNSNETHHYALHWLLDDTSFEQKDNSVLLSLDGVNYKMQVGLEDGNGNFSLVRADPNSTRGWRSRYYGHKEPAISVMLETDQPQVAFWTFFGFDGDVVEIVGNSLKVNSQTINLAEILQVTSKT